MNNIKKHVTISWNPSSLPSVNEYSSVILKNVGSEETVNMRTKENYTFTATAMLPHNFQITCSNIVEIHITDLNYTWNLISLPFNQTISKTQMTIIHLGTEYSWQEAVNNSIILGFIYYWNRTSQTYELADTLKPGYGYWMFVYESGELRATEIRNITEDNLITEALSGWNMIGLPDDEPVNKYNLTVQYNGTDYTRQQAIDGGIILGFIYEWNETSQTYLLTDAMNPGKTCWMYAYYDCTLLRP